MKTKKEMLLELRRKELLLRKLSSEKKKQKELLDYLTRTNYILFKFAQEVNHKFDSAEIIDGARNILKEYFSNDAELHLSEAKTSEDWLLSEESTFTLDVHEIIDMKKILFIPNTANFLSYMGENRKELINETNQGFQPLFKKWHGENFKETSFQDFMNICRTKDINFKHPDLQKIGEKVRKNVRDKILFCHKKNITSFAAVPLIRDNKVIGYFHITTKHNQTLIEEQIPLLNTLANLTVIAISSAEKYHMDVYLDNRTGFPRIRLLTKYLDEAIKKNEEFSLIVTDLDNFKQYVDKHGHQAGQKAIDDCGFLIKSKVSKDSKLAILGGDEYIIYLPDIDKKEAARIAEEIRESVSNFLFDKEVEGDINKIKISVGVAHHTDIKSTSLEEKRKEIIKKADDALFNSKRTGRNKVSVWGEI